MKLCYYIILWRPRGSQTWTPVPGDMLTDHLKGNFFANSRHAQAEITNHLLSFVSPVWMAGLKQYAPYQFTVGYVHVMDTPDITTAPDPSPNLKPPL